MTLGLDLLNNREFCFLARKKFVSGRSVHRVREDREQISDNVQGAKDDGYARGLIKKRLMALTTVLMMGCVSAQAMDGEKETVKKVEGDIGIRFIEDKSYYKESFLIQDTYNKNDLVKRNVNTVQKYIGKLETYWKQHQNGIYKKQDTFMDILVGHINLKESKELSAKDLNETSQLRLILKGFAKANRISDKSDIWKSIDQLSDNQALLWWQAIKDVYSKDSTFFKDYFNLTTLDLSFNQLREIDVTKNIALVGLELNNNKLKAVDVTQNTALTKLEFSRNQNHMTIDFSQNTLIELYLFGNKLTTADVTKNTAPEKPDHSLELLGERLKDCNGTYIAIDDTDDLETKQKPNCCLIQ